MGDCLVDRQAVVGRVAQDHRQEVGDPVFRVGRFGAIRGEEVSSFEAFGWEDFEFFVGAF